MKDLVASRLLRLINSKETEKSMELAAMNFYMLSCCFLLLQMVCNTLSLTSWPGNETDRLSLLAIKAQIINDPLDILGSWNQSLHFCEWRGVTCGRRHKRVIELKLNSTLLTGTLSPHIGNLTFLRSIYLQNNSLSGHIPKELGHLFRLQYLHLANNSFNGEIPVNISRCSNLQLLHLGRNNLTGRLPTQLGFLTKMMIIYVHRNHLVGELPLFLGNFTSLKIFSARDNGFNGAIPNNIGQLKRLSALALGNNNLTGTLPSSLYNLSSLVYFAIEANQLHGSLPSDLGISLPSLEFFSTSTNKFTGQVPTTFSNASKLSVLQLEGNKFTGKIPDMSRLTNLRYLVVADNDLGNCEEDDLDFLFSLANKTDLNSLQIQRNNFGGTLPDIVSNFSVNFQHLNLQQNCIHGRIPRDIGNLVGLTDLILGDNDLRGEIPSSIGKLKNLFYLYLYGNKLSSSIPLNIGNLTSLGILFLHKNNLSGRIPSSLGNCRWLIGLHLRQNRLTGSIPMEVLTLTSMATLDLSMNELTGTIPIEVSNLVNLGSLCFAGNKLSGKIPEALGKCVRLEYLYLEDNSFEGMIPRSLISLKAIRTLNLSGNNLTGQIPKFLEDFKVMEILDLSVNDLEGEVPTKGVFMNVSAISVQGNQKLCGGISQLNLQRCLIRKSRSLVKLASIAAISSGILGVILLLLGFCFHYRYMRKKQTTTSEYPLNISPRRIPYGDLFKATNGFSPTNLVGEGGFGVVYKGVLKSDGKVVAIKVLNLLCEGASRSFMSECEIMTSIRHRNLAQVLSACSSTDFQGNDFKALVYEFMTRGDLEEWLHPIQGLDQGGESKKLGFIQRLNIAVEVASALDYLHHQCDMPIVHCDLKPSNVLLDDDMTAHVGDFGLSRIITLHGSSSSQSNSVGIKGSIGYLAPEYAMGSEVSTGVDVYSYGVLLLEMFTGLRPTDDIFSDELNLHKLAKSAIPDRIQQIMDPMLLAEIEEKISGMQRVSTDQRRKVQECLAAIIKIGVECSAEMPSERLNISIVAAELKKVRNIIAKVLL